MRKTVSFACILVLCAIASSIPMRGKTSIDLLRKYQGTSYIFEALPVSTRVRNENELLGASMRPAGGCSPSDVQCMNVLAVAYTNAIRRRVGLRDLGIGTNAMLQNALAHSRVMASRGKIFHQQIGRVYVGSGACYGRLTGENVALNFYRPSANAAAMCVEQWRKSPPHYRNIVKNNNANLVIGIYIDQNRKIWCTQTFSRTSSGGSGICAVASSTSTSVPRKVQKPTSHRAERRATHQAPHRAPKPQRAVRRSPHRTGKHSQRRETPHKAQHNRRQNHRHAPQRRHHHKHHRPHHHSPRRNRFSRMAHPSRH